MPRDRIINLFSFYVLLVFLYVWIFWKNKRKKLKQSMMSTMEFLIKKKKLVKKVLLSLLHWRFKMYLKTKTKRQFQTTFYRIDIFFSTMNKIVIDVVTCRRLKLIFVC